MVNMYIFLQNLRHDMTFPLLLLDPSINKYFQNDYFKINVTHPI